LPGGEIWDSHLQKCKSEAAGASANFLLGTITFCNPRELPLIQVRAQTEIMHGVMKMLGKPDAHSPVEDCEVTAG